ncbi:MAG: TIGR02680 family protein [Bacillota bacterium]
MKNARWQLHRAGLLNFWYYDDEEFNFANGKLLLRGNNGSGKSVTMQSFIPVLLDGRKSPDRLDPFGSRARKMEDYLLGEKDVVDRDERTGYLYLEYKRDGLEQYITTGIGLKAKRNSAMDFWGFVILDNRRINRNFLLYKNEYSADLGREQKIPLTRVELENRLGNGGKVVRTSKEYMTLVNKHVFGFENLADYEELIKLLIQLRSPKLSKDFRSTVIYEILNESLPGLSDEELRPLSDTIENMDQTKQQLEQLEKEQKSLNRLCKQYELYNQLVLWEKAQGLIRTNSDLAKFEAREKELQADLVNFQGKENKLKLKLQELLRENEILPDEIRKLQQHKVFDVEKEKSGLEQKITAEEGELKSKKESIGRQKSKELELRQNIASEEQNISKYNSIINEILTELDYDAQEAQLRNHHLARQEFTRRYLNREFVFDLWKKESQDYEARLRDVLKILERLDKTREDYKEADRELGEARKKADLQEKEVKKWYDYFGEEKGNLLSAIYEWQKNNQELVIADIDMQQIARAVNNIFDEYSLEDLKQIVNEAYRNNFRQLEQKLVKLNQQIDDKNGEITAKENEINQWKNKKDPEPPRHKDTIQARRELAEKNIPYLPFYQAVEFKPHVTLEQRERIESAISQMGLLDALIVPEKHLKNIKQWDKILKPKPQFFQHTLAELLYSTPLEGGGVTAQEIDNILQSILLEDSSDGLVVIKEDGSYQMALLQGHAPFEDASRYIGQEARRRYRQEMIAKLTEELRELLHELDELTTVRGEVVKRQEILDKELRYFPAANNVKEAYTAWQRLVMELELDKREVENKNNKVKKLLEALNGINDSLRDSVKDLTLPVNKDAYESSIINMQTYRKNLQELELSYKDYCNSSNMLVYYQQNLTSTIELIDELIGEINVIDSELERMRLQLENAKKRLNILGAEEIRRRINEVEKRLAEMPNQLLETKGEITNTINSLEKTNAEIQRLNIKKLHYKNLLELWQRTFAEELSLGLVKEVNDLDGSGGIPEKAQEVKDKLASFISDNADREKLTDRLNQVYFQEQGVLVEYRLVQETIGEMEKVVVGAEDLGDEHQVLEFLVNDLKVKSRRVQLLLEYSGKRVSPFFVLEQLDRDIELQKSILNDKDRELYEEIIMNSVGRIIRARISRAEEWVEKIDKLMIERNTSSGLTFSLRWRPLTAEWEDELDTKELVELLRRDPKYLKTQDMDRITQHFRSKITRAKEVMAEKGYGETFHQIIKEMLDYRKWFQFTLYYQRVGEKKKELTNNVFYTFSGGEKAMAMYIPLFSAAYSRYQEARTDAPYIISLDEAFAGVDENNIRDMFDLVEKLGFDYIMNSQALWGDYDTVSALAICELVRPQNAPYVTVVRYSWNGRERQLVLPAEEYELLEAAK